MKLKKPKFWNFQKPNFISNLLLPLSKIFGIVSSINLKKQKKFSEIKCICVGNIYLGGTGKTTLCIELKRIFEEANIKTCFIKKYYEDQVDEQIILKENGRTFIDKNRITSIKKAISENYQVAIFDDGLQDKSIFFDLTFICFNQINMIGNGRLIPAGPLRESLNILKKDKNIFVIGNNENNQTFKNILLSKIPDLNFYDCVYKPSNLKDFQMNKNYIIFSGIGNHETFMEMLKKNKFKILKDFEYPDHYKYLKKDIEKICKIANEHNAKILTTKKDYHRIPNEYKKNIQFIEIQLKIKQIDFLKNKINIKNEIN